MPLGLVHVLLRGRHGPPRHLALGQVRARYSLLCGTLRWINYCVLSSYRFDLILLCHMAHTNLATGLLLEADWTHVQLPNHPSKSHRPSDNIPAHRETNGVCRQRFPDARFFSFFFPGLFGTTARANGCPWNSDTCGNAANGGHLQILRWARCVFGVGVHRDTGWR